MKPEAWIVSSDTGASSKTIWAALMGVEAERPGVPYDVDDFGRCYRLLLFVPGWRKRLPEVAAKYPSWGPLVREWVRLEQLYVYALLAQTKETRQAAGRIMYEELRPLIEEGMLADGWVKTGPGSFHKDSRPVEPTDYRAGGGA